ncbi:restriction endonuclease subunit S [Pseudomonas sp. TMP25]|uniref:restriction endonuclease subunit S n=1 Tax=Pseudomonas sp. TMP25 TaxID=3136561 RepID=UPI003100FFD0
MSVELPAGWTATTLGDVANWGSGGTPSRSESSFYGGTIPWIKSGELNSRYVTSAEEHITEAAIIGSSAKIFPAGSVAIAMYGATIGKTAILGVDAATNQACAVGAPIEGLIGKELLYRLLQNEKESFIEKGKGGAQPNISQAVIKAHVIGLPPFAEQTRIAEKLDELLAQVDTLKARLDAIPALLKRFRQSVLAAAVSGRLTEERRLQHVGWVDEGSPTTAPTHNTDRWASQAQPNLRPATNSEPVARMQSGNYQTNDTDPKHANTTSLPAGWAFKNASDICGFITKGTTPSKDKMSVGQGDVPYIKVYNLTFTGTLDFSIDPTYVDTHTHSTDLKRSIVKPGDVLMNIVGPPLGKVSVVPTTHPEWNINQAIARFRAGEDISSSYLAICLRTESVLQHAISRAKATAGQFNLTLEICRDLPIPLPQKEEQTEIVRRVEQLFAFAEQLEAKIASAQSRINHLTQSILAKAFRGELVAQDPNDEPASELLERIKTQRTAAPKAKRGRKSL